MQEQDFNNQKQVAQLEMKIASLVRLKSTSSMNSHGQGPRFSTDSYNKFASVEESQFELLDQLDSKI